jgi:DNA-binding SARP family transcriptional activator/tetratricopeptide (TPR) repeat protein
MLSVSLLGDFRIRHDELPVAGVDSPRLQSLLAYLLLHRDAPQSRAHLAFLFWPDTGEDQARTNLRNLLHHLRRALPDADSYLEANVQILQWRSDVPLDLDVANFDAAMTQSNREIDPVVRRGALERAVSLYGGDLLPSCFDDWIIPERERLRQAYLGALERSIGILEDQRDYEGAIRHAQRLLRSDPLHEATYRRLIRLHALNGDRAGALRAYHTCATLLRRELDVEPSAATREAYEQLLGAESSPSPMVPITTASSPMVGRDKEWTQMLRVWRGIVAGGEPRAVILRGEAGIGKTRLAEELVQWANRQGIASAHARCYAAEGALAYAPAAAWLRARPLAHLEDVWLVEVARLLPDVLAQRPDLPRPGPLTEDWQRERLFQALSHAVLDKRHPLQLAIDDLQWCDRDTLEWLHFLLRFDRTARLLVVGTYRPEEIGDGHRLAPWLQALRHEGRLAEIELQPLDEAATGTLATHLTGREIDTETARLLYRETEGNPLFVVETVRAGLSVYRQTVETAPAPVLPVDHVPEDASLPPKVQSVLEARLTQLSPSTRELAGLAATIGREFSFTLLARASGHNEDALVCELDEMWQRRIVREHGADAYDFSHGKLREVAYCSMSEARRRVMHRRVAQALEALHTADLGPVSHQVAVHYERAGLPARAVSYHLRAAGVARQVYANEEAIALLQRGLVLVVDGGLGTAAGKDIVAQLYEALGDVLGLRAQHEEALQAYRSAQARTPSEERVWQARLHRKEGSVLREQRMYADALAACHRAEVALGERPDADDDRWWAEWLEVQVDRVWAHYWLAQWPEMNELVNKARPVVQERGSVASRARFLMASCLMHLRKDRYSVSDEMLANSREALAASEEWGSLKSRIDCQFELGFLHLWRREFDEAEENLQIALRLAETAGVLPMRTLGLTYLTILRRFRGQINEVRSYAMNAQAAAEAAHMPDYVAAAKGNQAWVAWRRPDLSAAEQRGQEALCIWRQSPLVYPFQWLALWPLITVVLARGREDEVWAYAQALLESTQQRLPDELNNALVAALQTKAEGRAGDARAHLDRALVLASEMGYL